LQHTRSGDQENGVLGIHHITAIAKNPQRNVDFYSGFLGLRLVKKTVNFDDPMTYHLYYGDSVGHPGTILTFFPWTDAPKGFRGTGQVTAISFLIPSGSMKYWINRLVQNEISYVGPLKRFNDEVIIFEDQDGLVLELISPSHSETKNKVKAENDDDDGIIWKDSPVAPEHAIRGFHSATLSEEGFERTASLLTDTLGFKLAAKDNEEGRFRFTVRNEEVTKHDLNNQLPQKGQGHQEIQEEQQHSGGTSSPIGTIVDVVCQPDIYNGYIGIGTVHHIAWRAANDKHQLDLRKKIIQDAKLNPTPVIDRTYFHSVYFREPGNILFEIATDPPGFTVDENRENLGHGLMLPEWLESLRQRLQNVLPPIERPKKSSFIEHQKESATN
jgi:glyoxalase family protein